MIHAKCESIRIPKLSIRYWWLIFIDECNMVNASDHCSSHTLCVDLETFGDHVFFLRCYCSLFFVRFVNHSWVEKVWITTVIWAGYERGSNGMVCDDSFWSMPKMAMTLTGHSNGWLPFERGIVWWITEFISQYKNDTHTRVLSKDIMNTEYRWLM